MTGEYIHVWPLEFSLNVNACLMGRWLAAYEKRVKEAKTMQPKYPINGPKGTICYHMIIVKIIKKEKLFTPIYFYVMILPKGEHGLSRPQI